MNPVTETVSFTGRVVPGRGIARRHIGGAAEELTAVVGKPLFSGSLNLVLRRPLVLSPEHAITFAQGRKVWPARIGGREVWLYRWRGTPIQIVEVLAAERLRDVLDLKDNDDVQVAIPAAFVIAPTLAAYARWLLLWYGRAGWYYSDGLYQRTVRNLETRLGLLRDRIR